MMNSSWSADRDGASSATGVHEVGSEPTHNSNEPCGSSVIVGH